MSLPRRPQPFVARRSEIARLHEMIGSGGLILIEGAQGLGKSWLALETAHQLQSQRKVVWVSLRQSPTAPATALQRIASQLDNLPDHIHLGSGDPEAGWQLLAQALEAARAVLFVDEIDRLEGLRELLSVLLDSLNLASVVAVSDARLPLDRRERTQAQTLKLQPLKLDESQQLLEAVLGEEVPAALQSCQGLPLLVHSQALLWQSERVVAPGRLVWEWLAPRLPAARESVTRLLSIARYGLPRRLLESLFPEQREALDQLQRAFFLDEQGLQVKLHHALAPALESRLEEGEKLRLHQRVSQSLSSLKMDSLTLPAAIYHHLAAGQTERARGLLLRHRPLLLQEGHFEVVIELCQMFLRHDPHWGEAYSARGEAQAALGKLELALADFASALQWAEPRDRFRCLNSRCHLLLDMGRIHEAEADAEAGWQLGLELGGRQPGFIKALNGKARVAILSGRPEEGEQLARQGLQLALEMQDGKGEAYARFILAQALWEQEHWEECLQLAQESLELARQQGEIRLTLLARVWNAAALLRLGKVAWAAELSEQTWRESRTFPDMKMRALAELLQAQCLQAQGRPEQALIHLHAAESVLQRCGFPVLTLHSLMLKGGLEGDDRWFLQAQRLAQAAGVERPTLQALHGDTRDHDIVVWSQQGRREMARSQLDEWIREAHLYIDVPASIARERQLGDIAILPKKILMRLLRLLLTSQRAWSAEQLYTQVWGHESEGEAGAAQVRKNISALRNLIEPERSEPRYILMREHSYGVSGGYLFTRELPFVYVERLH